MASRSSWGSICRPRSVSEFLARPIAPSVAVMLLALVLSSCSSSPLSPEDRRNLAAAEAQWNSHGFVSYSFEMRRSCFCAPVMVEWARIEVVDGEVHRVILIESGTEVSQAEREFFPTIVEVFASIHSILNGDWMETIDFEFDPELGFPTEVHFSAKEGILDAGGSYFLRNVMPVGP